MPRLAVLFLALSGLAAAQTPVQPDFGVRGGLLANHTFQANQLCSSAGCVLATHSFSSEGLRGTIGATIGVLLYDRVEVRFEAVHRRFGYQVRSDVLNPFLTQHSLETVRGHLWEYPLIGTYHFGSGPSRPYLGGGLSLAVNGRFTFGEENTSTMQLPSGPVTTTSFVDRPAADLFGLPTGYYVVGGVDNRVSYFSIRPEFQYTHFPKQSGSAEAILTPNQYEFVLGISIHPYRTKK